MQWSSPTIAQLVHPHTIMLPPPSWIILRLHMTPMKSLPIIDAFVYASLSTRDSSSSLLPRVYHWRLQWIVSSLNQRLWARNLWPTDAIVPNFDSFNILKGSLSSCIFKSHGLRKWSWMIKHPSIFFESC